MIVGRGTPILFRNQLYFARETDGRQKQVMGRLELGTLHLYGEFSIETPGGPRNIREFGKEDCVSFFPYLQPQDGETGLLTQSGQQTRVVGSHELWSLGAAFFTPQHTTLSKMEAASGRPVEHSALLDTTGSFLNEGYRKFYVILRTMTRVQLLALLRGIFFAVTAWEALWPSLSKLTRQHLYGRITTTPIGRLAGHAGIIAYRKRGDRMAIPDSLYAWNVKNLAEKAKKVQPEGLTLSVSQHFAGMANAVKITQNSVIGFHLGELLQTPLNGGIQCV